MSGTFLIHLETLGYLFMIKAGEIRLYCCLWDCERSLLTVEVMADWPGWVGPQGSLFNTWFYYYFFKYLFIWLCLVLVAACGILVPRPGIEPGPPASGAPGLSHWTTSEVQLCVCGPPWVSPFGSVLLGAAPLFSLLQDVVLAGRRGEEAILSPQSVDAACLLSNVLVSGGPLSPGQRAGERLTEWEENWGPEVFLTRVHPALLTSAPSSHPAVPTSVGSCVLRCLLHFLRPGESLSVIDHWSSSLIIIIDP